jgi:primosomal protein N'
VTNYTVLVCPDCTWGTRGRRGQWKAYLTPNQIKLHCRFCGYTVRIPLACTTCGADTNIHGEGTDPSVRMTTADFIAITTSETGGETDETKTGV